VLDTKPKRRSLNRATKFVIIFLILLLIWAAAFWFLIEPHPTAPKQVTTPTVKTTKKTKTTVPTTPPSTPTHANYPTPPPSANNAAPGLFPVHPNDGGYFDFQLAPGQSATATVIVSNKTKSQSTYLIYPTAGITSNLTGLQYDQPDPGGSANWINMKPHLITLKPNQGDRITVPVTVPKGVKPGDYVDAIVGQGPPSASTDSTTHKGTSASILVTNRTIIAIVVSVPGPDSVNIKTSKPTLAAEDGVRQVLNFPIKETGDRLAVPHINAKIQACGGGKVYHSMNEGLNVFVPFTSVQYPVYLNSTILPAGCYTFDGTLSMKQLGGSATTTHHFHYTFNVTSSETHVSPSKLLPTSTQKALNSLHAIERDVVGGIGVLVAALIAWIASRDWTRKKKNDDDGGEKELVSVG